MTIDVLANDNHVGGDVLAVNTFDATSVNGGTVNRTGIPLAEVLQAVARRVSCNSGDDLSTRIATALRDLVSILLFSSRVSGRGS